MLFSLSHLGVNCYYPQAWVFFSYKQGHSTTQPPYRAQNHEMSWYITVSSTSHPLPLLSFVPSAISSNRCFQLAACDALSCHVSSGAFSREQLPRLGARDFDSVEEPRPVILLHVRQFGSAWGFLESRSTFHTVGRHTKWWWCVLPTVSSLGTPNVDPPHFGWWPFTVVSWLRWHLPAFPARKLFFSPL